LGNSAYLNSDLFLNLRKPAAIFSILTRFLKGSALLLYGFPQKFHPHKNPFMRILFVLLVSGCLYPSEEIKMERPADAISVNREAAKPSINSWQGWLQNLPETKGDILDYRGKAISNQSKHFALLRFDVGSRDLQQCADALIRLRAEFLFGESRFDEISFRFTSGERFSYTNFLAGKRPVSLGRHRLADGAATSSRNAVYMVAASPNNHESLRKYLDIVYTYTNTIALERDLKPATDFAVGTIVVHGGSPGHCFMIIDELKNEKGQKVFKLAEGYMPAQTIYVLKNPEDDSPWHLLSKDRITTASYDFKSFELRKFE
jgi:hypothetical protein